jgi:YfiH family protein
MILPLTNNALAQLPNIRHGFFTRQGGVSTGLYSSLNCGFASEDNPDHVAANRAIVAQSLQVPPENLLNPYQVHSPTCVTVDAPFTGDQPCADALVTCTPDLAIGVLTADCAPVLFASRDGKVAGAAHAGWKGAIGGVLEATVEAMTAQGAVRRDIIAAIGPCIAQSSYEVGTEFRDAFTAQAADYAGFFMPSSHPDHFHFDLLGFVRHRLEQAGVGTVEALGIDTYADEARFFSYRRTTHRGETAYGRQMSAIAIGSRG